MIVTWGTIQDKINRDLMLEDEDWIDATELLGYGNEALREAVAIINGLYEDYFLDYALMTLAVGVSEFDTPDGLYANKIRRFLFEKGSIRYVIPRLQDWRKFEEKSSIDFYGTSTRYAYFIASTVGGGNLTNGGDQIILTPSVRAEDAGAYFKLWYIREPVAFQTVTDTLDIPEFVNFIYAHIKVSVYAKEGHPNLAAAAANLQKQQELMEGTLASMVPDADNEIEPDLDWYREMN